MPLACGRVFVVKIPNVGLRTIFPSDVKGPDRKPQLHRWLGCNEPVKVKMGAPIDSLNGYYLIVSGAKRAAQQIAYAANSEQAGVPKTSGSRASHQPE